MEAVVAVVAVVVVMAVLVLVLVLVVLLFAGLFSHVQDLQPEDSW